MKIASLALAAVIILLLVTFAVLSRFFVDLLWFSTLGFRTVFTTVWLTEITVFFVAAGLSAALLVVNGLIAARTTSTGSRRPRGFRVVGRGTGDLPELIEVSLEKLPWRIIILVVALLLGLFIGFAQTGNWNTVLKLAAMCG